MPLAAAAQQPVYYDITAEYLYNAAFDEATDYGAEATGNVTNTVNTPPQWERVGAGTQNFLGATFRYGTAATAYGFAIPATNPDGSAEGNCLTLSAAQKNEVVFYQSMKLPAGTYQLIVNYYNCNTNVTERDTEVTGISLCGWKPAEGEAMLSVRDSFPRGEWVTDTISFVLTEVTDGRLQVGYKSPGSANKYRAILSVDRVQLLRDTPYGPQDDIVPPPTVVTDPRFARGATMAFGRIKQAKGDNIVEEGFCWAENPEPTIDDNATTEYLNNNGQIYWLKNLKPATLYYMRAYAKNKRGKVGYGDVIKFYTIPKGQITFSMRTSGDDASNRIKAAAQTAIDWWNNLTEMKGFNTSIGYNSGVPTAECSYGGWMSVGSNSSYQRPGTIMHEMLHGVGVIPWADTEWSRHNLRSGVNGDGYGTGLWLGDRVTEVLRFWDNNNTSQLNGDYQHMWPYGINGANEDNGSDVLYIGNGLVCQALGEDGLQHTNALFAEPYYALDQEDDVKYYLKNESDERGLYTSYLIPTATGTLNWRAMTAADAQQNDSTAWYVTFTPQNQYYQFRNAATGQYLTFAGGFKTMERASITANDNFHLMRGRVDVGEGDGAQRGYWIIHPTDNWTPNAMQANANGAVGSATFNISNKAENQRWLIITADEMNTLEQASIAYIQKNVTDLLAQIKPLAQVPHVEEATGTDQAFADALADIEQRAGGSQVSMLMPLADEAIEAAYQFLCNVTATTDTPFDLTWRIRDAGLDAADGWSVAPDLNYSCGEFYQKTFDFNQTIQRLPAGSYQLRVQGFQRPGTSANAYSDFIAGNDKLTAFLYAGTQSTKLAHIATEAQTSKLGGEESTVGDHYYMPNNMQAASIYFKKGLYENVLDATIDKDGSSLKFGLRSTSMPSYYWVIFDNFRLHFFGNPEANAISTVNPSPLTTTHHLYDLQGRRVQTAKPGLYIIDGHKVVIK